MNRIAALRLAFLCAGVSWEAAWAQAPNPYLAEAKDAYRALQYERCEQALSQASRWQTAPSELAEVELYDGLCRYNLGKVNEAVLRFELALRLDPQVELPPLTSPKIQQTFKGVAERAARERPVPPPEPTPPPEPLPSDVPLAPRVEAPPLAEAPRVVAPAPSPPSQTLRTARWVLGGSSVVSLGAGITLGLLARRDANRANASAFEEEVRTLGDRARREAVAANVSYALAATLAAVAGITYLVE